MKQQTKQKRTTLQELFALLVRFKQTKILMPFQ